MSSRPSRDCGGSTDDRNSVGLAAPAYPPRHSRHGLLSTASGGVHRILGVADSDSYLKWGAALLNRLPDVWNCQLALIRTPIVPTAHQGRSAVAGTRWAGREPPTLSALELMARVRSERPHVVLLACTGPVVDALLATVLPRGRHRPAYLTGLPGISVPATADALLYRRGCDTFIVHSRREVRDFAALRDQLDLSITVELATLPFLFTPLPAGVHDEVVFATQAKVPRDVTQREAILLALDRLARVRTDLKCVVKLRAAAGERQTHHETYDYESLWRRLVSRGAVRDGSLSFSADPMAVHLSRAAGFVTVSSTALLEAVHAAVPALVLGDFGISADMITEVFAGSGLIGTLNDLRRGAFRSPDPTWLTDNYFHDSDDETWREAVETQALRSTEGLLPPLPRRRRSPGPMGHRQIAVARLWAPASVSRTAADAALATRMTWQKVRDRRELPGPWRRSPRDAMDGRYRTVRREVTLLLAENVLWTQELQGEAETSTPRSPRAVLAVGFDSQLKWAAAIRRALEGRGVQCEYLVPTDIRTSLSEAQINDYGGAEVERVPWNTLLSRAAFADIVVSALAGPPTERLLHGLRDIVGFDSPHVPVVLSGWVGVIIERHTAGLLDRCAADVIAVNSSDDLRYFESVYSSLRLPTRNLLLSGLPLIGGERVPQREGEIRRVLFADQPTIPRRAVDRRYIYSRLIDYALEHPDRTVAFKPRHRPGEDTFHRMIKHPEVILADLAPPDNFIVDYTAIDTQLKQADLVMTVSSTAAIEAIGAGCRAAFIGDLGVREDLGNHIFLKSGLIRTFDQIERDDIGDPDESWAQTYFPEDRAHSPADVIADRVVDVLSDESQRSLREMWQSDYFISRHAYLESIGAAERHGRIRPDYRALAAARMLKRAARLSLGSRLARRLEEAAGARWPQIRR